MLENLKIIKYMMKMMKTAIKLLKNTWFILTSPQWKEGKNFFLSAYMMEILILFFKNQSYKARGVGAIGKITFAINQGSVMVKWKYCATDSIFVFRTKIRINIR